jgi:hypothetical protein
VSQARRRIVPILHPGTPPARRGTVGIVIIVALFVGGAALGLFVASQHHGIGPTAKTVEVTVSHGQMTPDHITVRDGDQVVLSVTGDQAETITLSGYQQRFTLIPGVAVAVTFIAGRAGKFDFTLESSGKTVGQLEVTG